ncbi:uroporphyrinogen decarboxylase family protein [Actinomycetota bacterium]
MNIRERMLAVLNGEKPDRVPFFGFSELFPRGNFERYLRNNGMGLVMHATPVAAETPNVSSSTRKTDKGEEIISHTPLGDISIENILGTGRQASPEMWKIRAKFFLKEFEDYDAIIAMVKDTIHHIDMEEFKLKDTELGDDGLLHILGALPSYTESEYLMGLERWGLEQYDHPEKFHELLDALDKRSDNLIDKLSSIYYESILVFGDVSDSISPENYRKYEMPFYEKAMKKLRPSGKKCGIHTHAAFLKRHKEWLGELKLDFIESYTPPPYSDIPIDELREALGGEVTILINFPETIFYKGYDATKKYTKELLNRDSSHRKMLGFSEMGMMGAESRIRDIFEDGFRAVVDAIEEIS